MTDTNDMDNEDKKQLSDDEREKMLNVENIIREDIKDKIDEIDKEKEFEKEKEVECEKEEKEEGIVKTGEVEKMKKQLEESQKESHGRIRVPIGGIKIPGFLRSRSRDKNKEGDATAEEGADLLEANAQKPEEPATGFRATLARQIGSLAARNPFAKKETAAEGEEARPKLLDRIKLPSVAALPKKFSRNKKTQDVEQGPAELASVETLEDGKPASSPDDGMESVKLDGDDSKDVEKEGLAGETPKLPIYRQMQERIRRLTRHEKMIAAAVLGLLFLLIIIIAVSTNGGPHPTAPPVLNGKVETSSQCGSVEGLQEGEAFVFRGIPYAAQPVGQRRWKPAQELNNLNLCWQQKPFLAHNASRQCWQEMAADKIDGFEDCLTLDVYTPEVRYVNPAPVVVLIDTAGLLGGPPGILQPSSKLIHKREIVFVKPNFRLGVLGFLSATSLSEAVHPPSSGNYGISDIIVALKWVRTNIVHFGGDPNQVTLLGHRAGATLVTALTTSPAAKGLFQRAWAASGSSMFPGEALQRSEMESQSYVDSVCPDTRAKYDCLMNQTAETLLENIEDSWKPVASDLPEPNEDPEKKHDWIVLDGRFLQTHVWSESAERHAKLVVGTTAQSEGSAALWEKMQSLPGERGDAIQKHVSDSVLGQLNLVNGVWERYNQTWEGLVTMVSDIRTVCPLLAMARAQQNVTFYVATLARNHTDLGSIADVDLDMSSIMGRYEPNTELQQAFVKEMQDVFYSFVESGELPPSYVRSQPVLTISRTVEWKDDYPNCDFWIKNNIVPKYARHD